MNQPEAPLRSDWRVPAFVIGCILLAAVPAILTAFDEVIDRGLHLSDVWPDFWTLLSRIEALWFGGVVLGGAFIGGRALVNRLRARSKSVWYRLAAAVWWLLLALAPILLIVIVAAVHHRLDPAAAAPNDRGLLDLAPWWLNSVLLIAIFLGGRRLRAQSKTVWYVIGTAICWLLVATAPLFLIGFIGAIDRNRHYVGLTPDLQVLLHQIAAWWLFGIMLFAMPLHWGRELVNAIRARSKSVWSLIIGAIWWILLALAPASLIGAVVGYDRALHLPEMAPDVRTLITAIARLWYSGVILLAALIGGRRLLIKLIKFAGESDSVRHLLIVATGWMLLALVLALVPAILIDIFLQALQGNAASDFGNLPAQGAVVGFFVVIVFGALVQGQIAGQDDIRAGLSDVRVSNRGSVATLAVWIAVYAALVSPVLRHLPKGLTPSLFVVTTSPSDNFYVFLVGIGLAPLAEELFLRGWM